MKKCLVILAMIALPAWALDLNTATVEQIAALKGMTRQTAEAIVAARTQNGPFKTSADVLKVSGVTQGVLNQNRATLTIAGKPVTTRSGTAPAIPGVRSAIPAKKAVVTQEQEKEKKTSAGKNEGKGDGGNKGGNDHGGGKK